MGTEALTVSSVAVSLTLPRGAEMAVVSLETANIRYKDDGTSPTASVGVLLAPGGLLIICPGSIGTIKFIAQTSDALLNIAYYGR